MTEATTGYVCARPERFPEISGENCPTNLVSLIPVSKSCQRSEHSPSIIGTR
jgi:hypothetical protein